jgi:hypothetical protein
VSTFNVEIRGKRKEALKEILQQVDPTKLSDEGLTMFEVLQTATQDNYRRQQ